ncbi:MAG: hypothetical protein NW241_12855 [Bacteroidia bacterium]|nr:hypothetical protein [Bacteroidia bacterium]
MGRNIYLAALTGLVICWSASASAQPRRIQDVLYLHNGWIIRGDLISAPGDTAVSIRTAGDNVFTFRRSEISWQGQELNARSKIIRNRDSVVYSFKPGLAGHMGFGLLTGNSTFNTWIQQTPVALSAQAGLGYRLRPQLQAGVATGIDLFALGAIMPLMLDLRGDLLKRRWVTPHYYMRVGHGFMVSPTATWADPNLTYEALGGRAFDAGGGLKLRTAGGFLLMTFGYRLQRAEERVMYPWSVNIQRFQYNRLAMSFLVGF